MNKLPRDIILIISKMHPLIIPPFTNKTLRRAVKDYLAGGDRKKRIVEKYGEISTWDTSKVTNMEQMFDNASSCVPKEARRRGVQRVDVDGHAGPNPRRERGGE